MKAASGSKSGISRSFVGKRRLLCGTGGAALALALFLPSTAWAADYTASTDAELRQAILDANADGDASSTITLTGNIAVGAALPNSTKTLIINTGGFSTNGMSLTGIVTVIGTVNGNEDLAGGNGQAGLSLVAVGGIPITVTNNATVTGGDGTTNSTTGLGANVLNSGTLINNGTITGGSSGGPASVSGGHGVQVSNNASVINNGTIQGGAGLGVVGGTGAFIGVGVNGVQSFTNNATGIVRGGDGTGGALGGAGIEINALSVPIVNHGLIEGGNGAAAIRGSTQAVNIVNNGTIRAGAGGTVAMDLSLAQLVLLELQAGSNITGLVIANATPPAAQTLQFGGSVDASFNMSNVGAAAQYRNFTRIVKTGTSIWTLTGSAAGMPTSIWELQQGTILFDKDTAAGQLFANIINSGTLNFQQDSNLSAGSINGGSVIQSGSGTTTLTAGAGYTYSSLAITAGKLSVDTEAKLGTGSVTIDGGTLQWTGSGSIARTINWGASGGGFEVTGGSLALLQPLLGGGALTKSGTGVLTLVGDNSYTGGTTIAAGVLNLGNGGTTGSVLGDVVNNGTLQFNRSNDYTYAGAITGTGGVAKAGIGTITLTGQNSYGSGTSLSSGQLLIAGGGTTTSGGATSITSLGASTPVLGIDGAGSAFTTASINATGNTNRSIAINVTNGGLLRTTSGGLALRTVQLLPSSTNTAQLTIDGAGSLADLAGGLTLASVSTNTGSVTISGGGALRTGDVSAVGFATGNTRVLPTVTITGAGSNWTSTSSLAMSNGAFTLDQGGVASFTNATFGSAAAGARLTVSGAGSRLATTAGDLVIGSDAGTGELVLSDGGAVAIAGSLSLADAGTATGILSIGGGQGQAAAAVGSFTAPMLALGSATSRLNFNHTGTDYLFSAAITGAGTINQVAGDTNLTAVSTVFNGTTNVSGGTLRVNGTLGDIASVVNVLTGGRLGGAGRIGGSVNVADGVLAAGNSPGTLTIAGDLTLTGASLLDFEFGQSNIVGGPLNDLIEVGGNLTLDGTIDVTVTPGGSFDVGVYRVINYAGTLNDLGLLVGSTPGGGIVAAQTSVANQVNLVNFAGADVNFWDGNGARGDGILTGGNGAWQGSSGNDNWTVVDGSINTPYPDSAFAVFMAAAGTVTVDTSLGAVNASGMQFASDGYFLTGDAIGLTGPQSVIRVGDGTAAGMGFTATIASALTGAGDLVKTDLGRLVLIGANSFAGEAIVKTGVLLLANGGTLTSLNTIVGRDAGEQAILTVTGSDGGGNASTWTTGDLAVGDNGTGTLNITAGGRVLSSTGLVGLGGTGQVLVSGAGSAWENSGRVNVGLFGTGTMRIENGGQVSSNDGIVGSAAHGEAVITGAGSIWTNVGQFTVGLGSTGSVRIENGGSVTSNQGYVGANAGGDGSVTVTGAGSNWLVGPFNITIGNNANGTLTIENGGRVRAEGGIYLGGAASASGTLTLTGTAANRAVLETSGLRAGAGTVNVSIDGGLLRATAGNGTFFNSFGTRDVALGANGVAIDTDGHAIGISPRFTGAGGLIKDGAGTLLLSGANTYGGATLVNAGTLLINGNQSAATGLTSVAAAATLGGSGTIGGSVDMSAGGTLAAGGNGVGTLTINGNLVLGGSSQLTFELGQANTPGGALNDLVNVGGDLTLAGTINVTVPAGGNFGIGLYRVFNYGGVLTDSGLTVGSLPPGGAAFVQTAIGGQVNLINTGGATLNFWDGAAGPKFDSVVNGGSGVWQNSTGNDNWTDASGAVNAAFTDNAVAIFAGSAGTVTVDNGPGAVSVGGMQFATGGYVITGDAVALANPQSVIRVGDGTAIGAGFVATISSALTGAAQLVKTDAGTLVLTGANSYTGGTRISEGTLRISSDANLGGATGALTFDTGTLNTTASFTSARAVNLAGAGTFLTDAGTTLTASGVISGAGGLIKTGAGTLVLGGANAYGGGTTINGGTLQVSSDANLGDAAGGIGFDGGTLRIMADFTSSRDVNLAGAATILTGAGADWILAGDIAGAGSLTVTTANTVTLTGNAAHSGGTTVTGLGSLQIGNNGTTGSIAGDIVNNANVRFLRSDAYTYAGVISGSGSVAHAGGGTLNLTADSSWAGNTLITNGGELRVANGNTVVSASQTTVSQGGTLTVSGIGSTWQTGAFNINSANTPTTLNVDNGGVVRASAMTLRSSPGGVTTANLNISGNGSLVDLTGALVASSSPVAVANIAINGGGALRSSGSNVIGGTAGNNAPSSLTITGAGSNWTSTGTLTLTNGAFSLLAGGGASFVSATIGTADEGADMLVSATNSIFTTIGDLVLGDGATGVGTLTLADSGRLSVGGTFTLANAVGSTGTLNIGGIAGGPAAAAGTVNGAITFGLGAGTLNFNHTATSYEFASGISGVGNINHFTGITRLTGDSSAFGGTTAISGGALLVNGTLGNAASVTNVLVGSMLGGSGTIGGNVFVNGGTLAPGNSPGTLTINGDLAFAPNAVLSFELGQANVVGGLLNDLINVGGNLTLDGTLNVTEPAGGTFGLGIYRLINYGGILTDSGLTIGSLPPGGTAFVQTGITGQVNLINTGGETLNFWDGAAGPKFNHVINGGNGVWQHSSGNDNWTDASGAVNAGFTDNAVAIFAAAAGTVTVDNGLGAVSASGMQFASDGYVITGDSVTLTGAQGTIRVGDGSAGSSTYTATIASELAGTSQLVKTDAGTLALLADNSYSGGTRIEGGTLRLGDGGATGSVTGDIVNNGALVVNRAGAITLDGAISGSGALTKLGGGTLILGGINSYAGGTTVGGGTVRVSNEANLGDVAGVLSLQGGTLQAGASFTSARTILLGSASSNRIDTQGFDVTLTGTIGDGPNNSAGNFLDKTGSGTLTLTGLNTYTNRTVIGGGTLALAGAGTIGAGNLIVAAGTVFDISQTDIGVRVIQLNSGAAGTIALGSKVLTLGLGNSFSDWSGTITDGGIGGGTGGSVVITAPGGAVRFFEASSYTGGTTIASGTLELSGNGSLHAGGAVTINGGLFNITGLAGAGTTIGDLSGAGSIWLGAKSLTFGTGNDTTSFATISGNGGTLVKAGTGTFTFGGGTTHTGGTTIAAGTLQIGNGSVTGSITGDIVDNGTLAFNRSNALTFDGTISGTGAVNQIGTGTTILTGANSYTGTTTVSGGTLRINGDQSAATGLTSVLSGGTLGGTGTIGGSVTVADGGTLAPGNSPGTLTIAGNLALSGGSLLAFEFGQANTAGGALNDLINVGGNLTLDGTIDVTQSAGGSFGPGVYRILNYGGVLTDNGLTVGSLPGGSAFVQTAIGGQVNLVNTAGLTLNFWDGAAGPKNDGTIQGGDGIWRVGGGQNNWTGADAVVNADYAQGSFAIFQGAGGTVTVDNIDGNVLASGMQFTVDGYTVTGQPLTLTGTDAFLRVGDGGAGDAAITATIASALTGSARLIKDMGGTVILTGTNSYSGGTAINDGTLNVSTDANMGDAAGGLSFNGGTLRTTTSFTSARTIDLVGAGTLLTDAGTTLTTGGAISGAGALIKDGAGRLLLTAADTHSGGTTIAAGIVELGNGGSITGTVANNGVLRVSRADALALTGTISGSGAFQQAGTGSTTLSGANSHAGATDILSGMLLINGNQSAATGLTTVAASATLGGTGTIGGSVIVADGATLAPGAGGAGTLTINGNLSLAGGSSLAYDFGAANAAGSPLNDVVNVGGNLALDGTINVAVTPGGAFDIGLYRVLNYGGTLTDNGLAIGTMPAGAELSVQTSVAGQVNLVNTGSAVLNFWDGAAGPKFNGAVDGGSGVWQAAGGDNWADISGAVNAPYDNGAFAIFAGTAGTVTIDNGPGAVTASGLQFASSGYTITGEALTLTGPQSVIRVGDGSAAGAGYTATIAAELTGNTQLVKTDLGELQLTGANSYTGGTAINGGTIRIANDGNLGAAAGGLRFDGGTLRTTADMSSARAVDLAGQGVFSTDAGTTLTLTGGITGAGLLGKTGAGTLVLTDAGSYTGGTDVTQGMLLVNGNHAAATGRMNVAAAATLGGTGTIGGDVNLAGTLAPGANGVGTLTINGDLTISQTATLAYAFGQANVAGGALNDLVNVGGDLTLDGTINVAVPAGGDFGAGIYRVFNYGGTLTNNGLTLGSLPAGSNVGVQTSIAGQVNLINFAGLALNFWDGAAGPKNNGVINGGNGVWQHSSGNDNWTEAAGLVNAGYSDGAFAVFSGTTGTVTVDNSLGQVAAGGMQFATSGYTITGGGILLTGGQATIRVGDGSTAGAGYTATINATLSGASELVKTDAGTLVLGGTNSYTGGTRIVGGTVQIASDANLGAAAGGVTFDGGTLAATATLTSARDVNFLGAGTLSTASGTTFTLSGTLTGSGALTKAGGGTLLLTGNNGGYTGATRVTGGTLAVIGAFGGTVDVGAGSRLEGTGAVGAVTNAGTVAPGRDGFGTLTVNGSYTGTNGILAIDAELGGDASRTDRLVVNGATAGSTVINVTNQDGLGAATVDGIRIVDVTGASIGAFTLGNSDYLFEGAPALIAGAYGYRLYKNGVTTPADGDWYLRSSLLQQPEIPLYQPGVPVYEAYGQTLAALNQIGTMQERTGNRQWASGNARSFGIWGRSESKRARPDAARSTSLTDVNVDSWKIELGADQVLSERSDGASLVLGMLGSYGEASANVASPFGNGTIKTQGYSAGATLSWFGPQGFYVDGRAQVSWFDSKLSSTVLGKLADDNKGTGQAYSIEIGKRAPIGGGLSVTPQIQTVYSTVGFDRFIDPNDAAVSSKLGDSLKTRWGISLDRQDGRSHVYGVVNVSYEWLDGTVTEVSGTRIARENHRLWGELGLGGSLTLASRLTLYSEVSADTAINDFGKSYGFKGVAGLRMAF